MTKLPRLTIRYALLFALPWLTSHSSAEQATYLGKTIEIVVPPGQCILGNSTPERSMKELLVKNTAGSNVVLAAFAECGELRTFVGGKSIDFTSYGQLMASTPKGQQVTMQGMPRATFLAKFPTTVNLDDVFKRAAAKAKERINLDTNPQSLGVLDTDHAAVYFGFVINVPTVDGPMTKATGVTGMTVARDLPLTVNYYRKGTGAQLTKELIAVQKATLSRLVAANP